MTHDRRSVLTAMGLALPLGLTHLARATDRGAAPILRLRPFEEAVRDAFSVLATPATDVPGEFPCRRIEVGHSEQVVAGLQGCHNDRPFAGFPTGHLRIIRSGSAAGPNVDGVRLYIATVDVALTRGAFERESRPFNFAMLPPAPLLTRGGDHTLDEVKQSKQTGIPKRSGDSNIPKQFNHHPNRDEIVIRSS